MRRKKEGMIKSSIVAELNGKESKFHTL